MEGKLVASELFFRVGFLTGFGCSRPAVDFFFFILWTRDVPSPDTVPANPIFNDCRRPAMGDWGMELAGA